MPKRSMVLVIALLGMSLAMIPAQSQNRVPSPLQHLTDCGWTSLVERLTKEKKAVPTGAGVWVAQVEPSVSGDPKKPKLRPDITALFAEPKPTLKVNVPSQPDGEASVHSTNVARHYYGMYAVATGITKVDVLDPGTEFLPKWLGVPKGDVLKSDDLPKVSSHSYVLEQSNPPFVRRLDEFIAINDHIAVIAVGKNEATALVAPVFGSSYNAIVVGLSNGKAGHGEVKKEDDGEGRTRPDLVVPVTETSTAAPITASAVAVLVEAAGRDPIATKPVVIKAILMAGAQKRYACEFMPDGWKHTETKPLHPIGGAGQLDIDTAHRILTAGQVTLESKKDGGIDGWAYESIKAAGVQTHTFDIPDEFEATSISATIVWNRTFEKGEPIVPNLDVSFGRIDEQNALDRHLDKSVSPVDNVEIIWNDKYNPPGRYGFKVTNAGKADTDYAIAWHATLKPHMNLRRDPPRRPQQAEGFGSMSNVFIISSLVVGFLAFAFVFRKRLRFG